MIASLILSLQPTSAQSAGRFTDEFGASVARVEHKGSKEPDWVAVSSPYLLGGKDASAVYCFGGAGHGLRWTAKEWVGHSLTEIVDMDGDSVSDLLANVDGEIVVLSGAKGTRVDSIPSAGEERSGPLASLQGSHGVCVVTALAKVRRKPMGVSCISLRSKKELWAFSGSDPRRLRITCIAPMPDLDKDGVEEVAVGYADSVVCLSGATGKQLFEVCGRAGDRLGFSVTECGDWNGDGVPDFVAGAPILDVDSTNTIIGGPGYACVLSGRDGAIIRRVEPVPKSVGFGFSIAPLSERASEGPRAFLVSAWDDIGEISVYLCSPNEQAPRLLCAKGPITYFMHLVRSVGDQDGDGLADFAVTNTPPEPDCMLDGSVVLFSSKDGKEICVLRRPSN